jgi:hypothetical protein
MSSELSSTSKALCPFAVAGSMGPPPATRPPPLPTVQRRGFSRLAKLMWSVKLEYLYVDLGRSSVDTPASTVPAIIFTTSTAFREQIVRVGLNYHFDIGDPVVARY